MPTLSPYLRFDGNCRQAMTFYAACLGGTLDLQRIGDSPIAGQLPPSVHDNIMHSTLTGPGFLILASDMKRDGALERGNASTLLLDFDDAAALRATFDKLAVGGTVVMPVAPTFWGAIYGQVIDAFGVEWNLNCAKP
jgi:PhnB protein